MVRYELKKIFGSVGSKVALLLYAGVVVLSCWLAASGALNLEVAWVNEQGESEYGYQAARKLRDARKEWEGWLDEEKLNRVAQENQRINATPQGQSDNIQQSNIAYGWKQGFAPIRGLISDSYAKGFREYDYYTADRISAIDENTFYANRIKLLKQWLYDETDTAYYKYSEPEKQYILSIYEELETPFYFDYYEGWYQLLENAGYIPALGILILGFLLAGIFSNEFKWKADSVYFSSLLGRNKGTAAKIQAGFWLVTVLYWSAMLVYGLFTLCYLGFDGAGCVIQWELWKTIYNLNMGQAWLLTLICGYIGNLFLAFLTMWISAKTRSTVFAVTVPFLVIFVPSFLEGMAGWLDKLLILTPVKLLEFYQNLRTFEVITVFGRVFRALDLCLPLYALAAILLVPLLYREFRKKQIA